jgi:hypothetical protein
MKKYDPSDYWSIGSYTLGGIEGSVVQRLPRTVRDMDVLVVTDYAPDIKDGKNHDSLSTNVWIFTF